MLLQRLITTLILVPLVLLALFFAPSFFLGAVVFTMMLLAGRECWQLIPLHNVVYKTGFLVLLALGFWACSYFFAFWLSLGLIAWVFICLAILSFPSSQSYWAYPVVVAGLCLLVLPLFIQSLIHLYQLPQGKVLLVYLLCLIWASDIGAYMAGKQFGSHKMIPQVSPGKSWEGVLGGFILAMLVAVLGLVYFKPVSVVYWFALAVGTVIISIFGDLFISILKRRCQIKDTGTLIPGHGGLLDRLDSSIAALPLFYFGIINLL